MDRDAARARIQQTLGFRTDKVTEIENALQDAQQMLERGATLPWFLLTEIASITTTEDEQRTQLPSDFLREWDEDSLYYFVAATSSVDAKWTPLMKSDPQFLQKTYPGTGTPKAYAMTENYFMIFPVPEDTYTLKMIYYKTDTTLATNVENDWLKYFPFLLIGEAGQIIAAGLRDKDALKIFQGWAEAQSRAMLIETEARYNEGRRYVIGGED